VCSDRVVLKVSSRVHGQIDVMGGRLRVPIPRDKRGSAESMVSAARSAQHRSLFATEALWMAQPVCYLGAGARECCQIELNTYRSIELTPLIQITCHGSWHIHRFRIPGCSMVGHWSGGVATSLRRML
jgi:hypothetical protein